MTKEALQQALEKLVDSFADVSAYEDEEYAFTNELVFIPDIKKAIKAITAIKEALAQPEEEPVFKWRSVFQEMPTKNSHILFCFGVHIVEGSYTKHGWTSLAYGEAQPDFWAYFPPPPHHKRNIELYARPPMSEQEMMFKVDVAQENT